MNRYAFGFNGYEWAAGLHHQEAPWWVFFVERTVDLGCDHMPHLRVPFIGTYLLELEDDSVTTWADYYGDHLDELWHYFVHIPVSKWAWGQSKNHFIAIAPEAILKAWGDDAPEWWTQELEAGKQMKLDEEAEEKAESAIDTAQAEQ